MPTSLPERDPLLSGRATRAGTRRYAERIALRLEGLGRPLAPDHFSRPDELWLSSIALGTMRGDPGGVDDLLYRSAVGELLEGGCNVFVTALSDRMQTSEQALGQALRRALREGRVARDEIVVVTKGGALTPDPARARDYVSAQRDLYSTYIDSGLVHPDEVHRGHSIAPDFLLDQIERSRRNLGLETIDYYLIQEPELQLKGLGVDGFREGLERAFAALEEAVRRGWIGATSGSSRSSRPPSTWDRRTTICARSSCPMGSRWAKAWPSTASSAPTARAARSSRVCGTRARRCSRARRSTEEGWSGASRTS